MITNILLNLAGGIISLIAGALSKVGSWVIPSQIQTSFALILNYLGAFEGTFPVQETMSVITAFLFFLTLWYAVHLIFKAFHLLPWFGKKVHPKITR
jgi:hypothetical protein